MGVVALHKLGVHGQFLVKKQRYWLKFVPGDEINAYMMAKPLGHTKLFVQTLEDMRFYVHCTCISEYVTKIMSTHSVLEEIQDHPMWRFVDGEWKLFKYEAPQLPQPGRTLG